MFPLVAYITEKARQPEPAFTAAARLAIAVKVGRLIIHANDMTSTRIIHTPSYWITHVYNQDAHLNKGVPYDGDAPGFKFKGQDEISECDLDQPWIVFEHKLADFVSIPTALMVHLQFVRIPGIADLTATVPRSDGYASMDSVSRNGSKAFYSKLQWYFHAKNITSTAYLRFNHETLLWEQMALAMQCVQCKQPVQLMCTGCSSMSYCSDTCQQEHWASGQHELLCNGKRMAE